MTCVSHRSSAIQHLRLLHAIFAFSAMLLVVACDSSDRGRLASDACTRTLDGVQYFDGSLECFKTLPEQPISGYWVVGHENSIFHADRPLEVWESDQSGAWLSLSEEAARAAKSYFDGEPHLLEVEFIGVRPGRLGIYDYGFRDGAYMSKLLRANEIKDVHWHRGEPPNKSLERTRER